MGRSDSFDKDVNEETVCITTTRHYLLYLISMIDSMLEDDETHIPSNYEELMEEVREFLSE